MMTIFSPDKKANRKPIPKPVNQYNLQGNFIKRWDSIREAALSLGKKSGGDIINCCRYKNKTAYKYIWKYAG